MSNKLDEARAAWQRSSGRFQKATPTRIAYMGDGQGFATSNLIVTEDPTKIYARRSLNDDRFFVVQSKLVQPAFNKPVILGFTDYEPDIEQVLDYHDAGFITLDGASSIRGSTAHHLQHEFGGGDEVFIDPRQFLVGLAKPTDPASMKVYITPFTFFQDDWNRFPGANSKDLTEFIPATDNRYVLIAVDPAINQLVYRPGTIFASSGGFGSVAATISGGMGAIPPPAGDEIPVVAILLSSTTTQINWTTLVNNIQDTRLFLSTPLKDLRDRIEALEGLTGNATDLPVTGAQSQSIGDALANAWALQGYQITTTAPTSGSFLAWDVNQNSWAPSGIPAGLGGEANTGTNIGTGFEVFREKSGTALNFRTLAPGNGVNIASSTSLVTITASAGGGETNTGENLGSGIGVFREKTGVNLLFKSLSPGNYTTIASGASEITIGSESEPNTAANLGTGIEVFREKSNVTLNLRTLVAGDNTTVSSGTSTITIAGTDTSNTGENLGTTGYPVFREVSGTSLLFRQLVPGTNMSLASAGSTITITGNAASGTEANTGENLGSGIGVFREKTGVNLLFKSLSPGNYTTVASGASEITIGSEAEPNTGINIGTGIPIFREKSGINLNLRTLTPGDGINIASSTSIVTITASAGGSISDNSARVYHNADQEINNNVVTSLSLNAERYDTDGFHDTATNNSRFTIPTGLAGKYYISAHVRWSANTTNFRQISLLKNNSVNLAKDSIKVEATGGAATHSVGTVTDLDEADYVEVQVYQNSGVGLSVLAGDATELDRAEFVLQKLDNAASTPREKHFSFTLGASNTWNNELIPIWQAPRGSSATILEILATTSGTTAPTLNFNFQVRDYNAMQSAGIDVFAASQAATSATEQFTSFTRAQVDPRGHLMFTTGSGAESGSVNYLNMTVYYTT